MASPDAAAMTSTGDARTGAPILELHKLDKHFGGTHALKGVNLEFEDRRARQGLAGRSYGGSVGGSHCRVRSVGRL